MTINNRYKKILSSFLIIIFLSPLVIKATHRLYIHHDKPIICLAKTKNNYHKSTFKCTICAFDFFIFIFKKGLKYIQKLDALITILKTKVEIVFINKYSYTFCLRAPPIKTKI